MAGRNPDKLRIVYEGGLYYVVDSKGNKKGSYQTMEQAQEAVRRQTGLKKLASERRWAR